MLEVAAVEPGERAWTDGITLYVDPAARTAEQVITLAVQASLLAAGSLDPDVVRQLRRRRAARRYLSIEGHRALAANEAYLPSAVCSVINHDLASRLGDATDSLALALGRDTVADPPPLFGVIRPRDFLAAVERSDPGSAAADRSDQQPLGNRVGDSLPELEEDEDTDEGYLGQHLSSPVGGGGVLGRLLKRLLGSTRDRGDGGPPGRTLRRTWVEPSPAAAGA